MQWLITVLSKEVAIESIQLIVNYIIKSPFNGYNKRRPNFPSALKTTLDTLKNAENTVHISSDCCLEIWRIFKICNILGLKRLILIYILLLDNLQLMRKMSDLHHLKQNCLDEIRP